MNRRTGWALLLAVNALGYCVLSFYQTGTAAPAPLPFANSIEQRGEMLQELKEIKELLKEQNAMLRSGDAKVTVQLPPRPVESVPAPSDGQPGS